MAAILRSLRAAAPASTLTPPANTSAPRLTCADRSKRPLLATDMARLCNMVGALVGRAEPWVAEQSVASVLEYLDRELQTLRAELAALAVGDIDTVDGISRSVGDFLFGALLAAALAARDHEVQLTEVCAKTCSKIRRRPEYFEAPLRQDPKSSALGRCGTRNDEHLAQADPVRPVEVLLDEEQPPECKGRGSLSRNDCDVAVSDNGGSETPPDSNVWGSVACKDFVYEKFLGEGSVGSVSKVTHRVYGTTYALKAISKKKVIENDLNEQLLVEVKTQLAVQHRNLLSCYDYFEDASTVYLVLEYVPGGDLHRLLRRSSAGKLQEPDAAHVFGQVVEGVSHLHSLNVIHRDLKAENVLLTEDLTVKIADFGWCAKSSTGRQTLCGTPCMLAPEMVQGLPYDYSVDVWAVGILLFEMLAGFSPFDSGGGLLQTCDNIVNKSVDCKLLDELPPTSHEVVDGLLQKDATKRMSLLMAGTNPWVIEQTQIRAESIREKFDPVSPGAGKEGIVRSGWDIIGTSSRDIADEQDAETTHTDNASFVSMIPTGDCRDIQHIGIAELRSATPVTADAPPAANDPLIARIPIEEQDPLFLACSSASPVVLATLPNSALPLHHREVAGTPDRMRALEELSIAELSQLLHDGLSSAGTKEEKKKAKVPLCPPGEETLWKCVWPEGVGILPEPIFGVSDDHNSGPTVDEVVVSSAERIGSDGILYLHLAESNGWVPVTNPAREVLFTRER